MTSYKISKWLAPEKYFISFPFGVFDIYFIRQHRKLISDKQKNIFFTYNKKSIIDNQFLPFTMTGEDFKTCRRRVNKKTTREYLPPLPDHQYPSQKLPLQDRWSARQFSFSEIFEDLRAIDHHDISLDWYHDVSTWDNYVGFISSDNNIIKPFEGLTRPHRHVKIPYTSGE